MTTAHRQQAIRAYHSAHRRQKQKPWLRYVLAGLVLAVIFTNL